MELNSFLGIEKYADINFQRDEVDTRYNLNKIILMIIKKISGEQDRCSFHSSESGFPNNNY